MKKYIIIILLIMLGVFGIVRVFFAKDSQVNNIEAPQVVTEPKDREEIVTVESGMTFSTISEEVGIGGILMTNILTVSEDVYDLVKIRVGRDVKFYFDKDTDKFVKLIYPIDTEEELFVEYNEVGDLIAERRDIDYDIKIKTVEGTIESSLYESAMEQNIDERAIISLADVFAWTVDFGMGIRTGDTYKFIYEERYRNGEYVMPGKILAAKFVNDGIVIEGYYFSEGEDANGDLVDGYFATDGSSLQKLFLKNPVDFKYISSGYTTNPRYIDAFSAYTSSHRAIDYVAAIGTPIRAVGNGVVVSAGWNSHGYGNFTSIRHNSVYTTNYAHQSKIYVKAGQHVQQGDIIGAVGTTGYSTGPHLHFEMVKNGVKINPLIVDLPSDKSISEDKMSEFQAAIADWQKQLNN